ncbi:MAG TPA: NAD(P)/FAD-dependent oxidoreductase [Pyrinomonadaceae bacterium]|nr:NAD(P)/FAD-dependent oxidoreductase [Pyrinomonadaceae bacterium]
MKSSVIVIGAGAAGLAAACDLSRAGHEVRVIEARNRVGGRVHTLADPRSAAPIELGAEFIHGKAPALFQIAQAANLKLYEVSARHWYFEDGQISRSHDFWQHVDRLMEQLKSPGPDRSLKDFLDGRGNDDDTQRAKLMVTRYVEGFHAADAGRIGIRGLVAANEAADSIDGDRSFRLERGYESLLQALRGEAESYGTVFQLQTRVSEIHWSNNPLTVIAAGSAKTDERIAYPAAAVIVTVPLSILQRDPSSGGIRFVPDLPVAKQAALRQLAMGNVLKLNLSFRERFWEETKAWGADAERVSLADAGFFHCPEAPLPTWWTQLPMRANLLVGWAGGPRADRLRKAYGENQQRILDQAIASLARIFRLRANEIADQVTDLTFHDWTSDPFTLGAYSYVPVNGLEAQRNLAASVDDKLFFAGEATSVGHIGTVHGAIESGQRAAAEILNRDQAIVSS